MTPALLAFIPSPSRGVFYLGPLPLHVYGLTLAIGVVAATYLAEHRWKRMGHDPKEISQIAVWIVIAGVIGARLYHVITDYQLYTHDPIKALQIWSGGLGIWGAVTGGAIAVVIGFLFIFSDAILQGLAVGTIVTTLYIPVIVGDLIGTIILVPILVYAWEPVKAQLGR